MSDRGTEVECTVCLQIKEPLGRSAPLGMIMCNSVECKGYYEEPRPSQLWPGETWEESGIPRPEGATDG